MKSFIIAVAATAMLTGGVGLAQAQQSNSASQQAGDAAQRTSDAIKINGNQAVATTSENSSTPAKGANSFTMAEAKSRLEKSGFSNVGDLTKDDNGVWHGKAEKSGNMTTVWLDYKGNSGESK